MYFEILDFYIYNVAIDMLYHKMVGYEAVDAAVLVICFWKNSYLRYLYLYIDMYYQLIDGKWVFFLNLFSAVTWNWLTPMVFRTDNDNALWSIR